MTGASDFMLKNFLKLPRAMKLELKFTISQV